MFSTETTRWSPPSHYLNTAGRVHPVKSDRHTRPPWRLHEGRRQPKGPALSAHGWLLWPPVGAAISPHRPAHRLSPLCGTTKQSFARRFLLRPRFVRWLNRLQLHVRSPQQIQNGIIARSNLSCTDQNWTIATARTILHVCLTFSRHLSFFLNWHARALPHYTPWIIQYRISLLLQCTFILQFFPIRCHFLSNACLNTRAARYNRKRNKVQQENIKVHNCSAFAPYCNSA
jgi:hypothetical protein